MDIPTFVSEDLILLSQALDGQAVGLGAGVSALCASVSLSVPSFLGLTLLLPGPPPRSTDGHDPVRLTFRMPLGNRALTPRSSLLLTPAHGSARMPPGAVGRDRTPMIVLYAERPGAFVDLAADVSWLAGTDRSGAVLDRHLDPPPWSGLAETRVVAGGGVEAESAVNQALGFLIASGRTPEQASADLDTAAGRRDGGRLGAARQLLHELDQRI